MVKPRGDKEEKQYLGPGVKPQDDKKDKQYLGPGVGSQDDNKGIFVKIVKNCIAGLHL